MRPEAANAIGEAEDMVSKHTQQTSLIYKQRRKQAQTELKAEFFALHRQRDLTQA